MYDCLYYFSLLELLEKMQMDIIKLRWWDNNPFKRYDCDQLNAGSGVSISDIGKLHSFIFLTFTHKSCHNILLVIPPSPLLLLHPPPPPTPNIYFILKNIIEN